MEYMQSVQGVCMIEFNMAAALPPTADLSNVAQSTFKGEPALTQSYFFLSAPIRPTLKAEPTGYLI